jgi:hypothetical protein
MFGKQVWRAAAAIVVAAATLGFAANAQAQWGGHGHFHGGHGHIHSYHGHGHGWHGGYGVYRPYYGPTWHDTTHFDYHPGYHWRHGNHFHYEPGHYHLHRSGHWHW